MLGKQKKQKLNLLNSKFSGMKGHPEFLKMNSNGRNSDVSESDMSLSIRPRPMIKSIKGSTLEKVNEKPVKPGQLHISF
jgi:hypothetical protein